MTCQPEDKPIVYYKFGKAKNFDKINISKGGIEARVSKTRELKPGSEAKCWRFYGMSLCPEVPIPTEFFAYGVKPAWVGAKSLVCPDKGALVRPTIDGKFVSAWGEAGSIAGAQGIEEVAISFCKDAGEEVCELEILYQGNSIFSKKGECPCTFEIKCSEDCPEGYIKCPCNRPPGYCCLPCHEISSQLSGIKGVMRQ